MENNKKIVCYNLDGEKIKVSADKLKFRPSVYGVLIEDSKILLSKQWDGYDFPGGGVEIDETIEKALKREFIEETGLEVEVLEPVHIDTSFFSPPINKKRPENEYWNCPMIYFFVKRIGGELSIDKCDEGEREYIDMPEWIDLRNVNKIKLINSVDGTKLINKVFKK